MIDKSCRLGFLWTTGSMTTVFCVKTCGLIVSVLIWSTTMLITGWASGRFGLFGVIPQIPSMRSKLIMNYVSVVLAALSGIFFILIKSSNEPIKKSIVISRPENEQAREPAKVVHEQVVHDGQVLDTDFPFLNRFSKPLQRALGSIVSALSGIFYGTMFIPDQYIRDHPDEFIYNHSRPPNNGLYYVGSQYSGILLSSVAYFIIYAICKRNQPSINPSVALPAMISGTMWAIANVGFILAVSTLKSSVAYPIVTVLPSLITSLWSLFWFHEIQGKQNYILLICGMIVRSIAALLSGLSA
jgi:multidrug transporter EmrE-like cation transporter